MAITVEKTVYSKWGNCIRISNGEVEIFCTIDIGPNIIRCAPIGKPNLFFEDLDNQTLKDLPDGVFRGTRWQNYGGHRFWVSPEAYPFTYYPAIDNVDYEILDNGVVLKQCNQEFNNIKLEMTVTMTEDGEITVVHKLENTGAWEIELAPWALTVLTKGGVEIIPQPNRETDLLANRVLAVWPYTNMGDERVTWSKDYIALRQNPQAGDNAFKIGINNEHGYAAYFVNGMLFLKNYEQYIDGVYPDYGVSFETYTNGDIMEMETLGELALLKPGETTTHTEKWKIFDNVEAPAINDADIKAKLDKYI